MCILPRSTFRLCATWACGHCSSAGTYRYHLYIEEASKSKGMSHTMHATYLTQSQRIYKEHSTPVLKRANQSSKLTDIFLFNPGRRNVSLFVINHHQEWLNLSNQLPRTSAKCGFAGSGILRILWTNSRETRRPLVPMSRLERHTVSSVTKSMVVPLKPKLSIHTGRCTYHAS